MKIDVVLNPAEIALLPQRDLSLATCVVFDVLRATSSMITALAHGAAEIYPVRTIEEAFALKKQLPHAVLAGERHGDPIPGFEVGNGPQEYLGLSGRTIISTTTNGTIALRACDGAARVLVGAMLNIGALAELLVRDQTEHLVLVCAGTFEDYALEDATAAGHLIQALPESDLTDSAQATLAVARAFPVPLNALRIARNGRRLAAVGRGEEVEWCGRHSAFKVVGQMDAAVIRPLPA